MIKSDGVLEKIKFKPRDVFEIIIFGKIRKKNRD